MSPDGARWHTAGMSYFFDRLKKALGLKPTLPTAADLRKLGEELGGEELEQGDADRFVAGQLVLFLDESSWLRYAKYYPEAQELEVGLIAGGPDGVNCQGMVASAVGRELAVLFARARSKGTWWWDYVFVRGKGNKGKTQRPVRRL